jgi:hypothetical protein
MNRKIKKAVFPVAGFGTRFLPATKTMPKELLPIVDKPLIQYAVEKRLPLELIRLYLQQDEISVRLKITLMQTKSLNWLCVQKEKMSKWTWCATLFRRMWNVYLFARLNN